ncbi:MAG: CPBP family intramembrane metalloprotease [Methanomicrobia archaeon]|nr:CPBP family intramembrane metalloprotease [Methanomicrobia archaeon]
MFNWTLFFCLFGISLPGIIITVPNAVKSMESRIKKSAPPDKKIPSMRVITVLGIVQSSVLILIAAAVGTLLSPLINFRASFFESLVKGENIWSSLHPQLLPSLTLGIGGGIVFVAAYYGIFRPRLDEETVRIMERLRMDLGLAGRLLYGGIAEEVLTRWGLLSFFIWLGKLIASDITPVIVWTSIVVSGILFGLGHLPSYVGSGCKKTPLFMTLMISLNLWASLIFGWLFWNYGLVAAIIAHMMFHLVWYPFDIKFYKRLKSISEKF